MTIHEIEPVEVTALGTNAHAREDAKRRAIQMGGSWQGIRRGLPLQHDHAKPTTTR